MPDDPFAVTCHLERVDRLIRHHLHALWAHPDQAALLPPLMLWGPPGVGKSAIVRAICAEEGIGFLDVRLAQREPIDLRGLPVPKDDAVHWLLPAEWPRDAASRGIILFDELTAADRTLQVAAYELILDRRLGDLYTVPPGWYLLAAGNRTEDRAVATTLSSALANRFCHLEVAADLGVWTRWAVARGVHPDVVAFLRFKPGCLFDMSGNLERGWPSPRTWERVSLELQLGADLDTEALRALIVGLVGRAAATEFLAFREWAGRLPDVDAVLSGRVPVVIPERADQRHALCAAVALRLWRADDRAMALRVFFDLGQRLTSDFAAQMMADALARADDDGARALMTHPRFEHWSRQHGAAFGARHTLRANRIADAVLAAAEERAA